MKHVKDQSWRDGLSVSGAKRDGEYFSVFDPLRGKMILRQQVSEIRRETNAGSPGQASHVGRAAIAAPGVTSPTKQWLPDFLKRDLKPNLQPKELIQ